MPLALLALSRKRAVMVLLVFVRNLEVLQAPPGTPLPDPGELFESLFLTQLLFFFSLLQEAEEILVQKWKLTP